MSPCELHLDAKDIRKVDTLRSASATGANAKIYQLSGVHSDDDEDDDDYHEEHSEEAMQDDEDDDDDDNAIYRLGSGVSHYPVLQATRIMPNAANAVREEEVEDEEEDERMGGAGAAGRRSENEGDSDEWAGM